MRCLAMIGLLLLVILPFNLAAERAQQAKPWLGVAIDKGVKGVKVKAVLKDTPAARAGMLAGDEIIAIDAKAIREPAELVSRVEAKGVGHELVLQVWRQGREIQQAIKLEVQPDALAMLEKLYVGNPAPSFELQSFQDKSIIASRDLKGKVVLLEFWATWCPACRSAIPHLNKITEEKKGLVVLAVTDESEQEVKNFARLKQLAFTIGRDPDQKVKSDYQVHSLPTFFLIDQNGLVRKVAIGAGAYLSEVEAMIDKLLVQK